MGHIRQRFLVLGAAGALSLGAILPASAAWIPVEPVPIVRTRAQESPAADDGESSGQDVNPVLLWSIASVAAGVVVMGTLYLLKRQVGGFPANPAWVAPITIMHSRDNATDATWGAGDDGHGHADAHGTQH